MKAMKKARLLAWSLGSQVDKNAASCVKRGLQDTPSIDFERILQLESFSGFVCLRVV